MRRTYRSSLLALIVVTCFGLLAAVLPSCSSTASSKSTAQGTTALGNGFPVGITSFTFVDERRPTPANAVQPGAPSRKIAVRVWYPAVAPSADEVRDNDFASVPDPSPMFDAPPATGAGPFPLIVFGHGLGGVPALYGDVLESWAAAGFVVAAPAFPLSNEDSPGGADGGDVSNQPGDVSAVITRALELSASAEGRALAGMIDGDHVGVAGHSNGGITTAGMIGQSCCFDDRVDAAIIISGTSQLFPGGEFDWSRTPPLLVIHGEQDALIPLDEGKRIFNNARAPKGLLTLLGIDHGSFLVRDSKAFAITVKASLDFWKGYLTSDAKAIAALPDDQEPRLATMVFLDAGDEPVTIELSQPPMPLRSASATPTTNLRDGQRVRVTWSGFIPGRVVNIVQCSGMGRDSSASCNLVTGKILQPDPSGSGSLDLDIVVGQVGNGRCDATTTDCVIVVNDASLQEEDANIRIPLTFAR